jgi:hypothetical protein
VSYPISPRTKTRIPLRKTFTVTQDLHRFRSSTLDQSTNPLDPTRCDLERVLVPELAIE